MLINLIYRSKIYVILAQGSCYTAPRLVRVITAQVAMQCRQLYRSIDGVTERRTERHRQRESSFRTAQCRAPLVTHESGRNRRDVR